MQWRQRAIPALALWQDTASFDPNRTPAIGIIRRGYGVIRIR